MFSLLDMCHTIDEKSIIVIPTTFSMQTYVGISTKSACIQPQKFVWWLANIGQKIDILFFIIWCTFVDICTYIFRFVNLCLSKERVKNNKSLSTNWLIFMDISTYYCWSCDVRLSIFQRMLGKRTTQVLLMIDYHWSKDHCTYIKHSTYVCRKTTCKEQKRIF